VLSKHSRFSDFCGGSEVRGNDWWLGASHIAAKASIDRKWRNATFYSAAAPCRSSFLAVFGGFRLFLSKAAGTVSLAAGENFNPALYEPFYDSACVQGLP
jgi:hypothetical protein